VSLPFDPSRGLIIVPTKLWGPAGDTVVRLALDTGATGSLVSAEILTLLGYSPQEAAARVGVTTGSGVVRVPRVELVRVEALGEIRQSFPILAHTLPASATVDGVLGLDFVRGTRLVIDFRAGQVTLE
jgi:hypothetical protein